MEHGRKRTVFCEAFRWSPAVYAALPLHAAEMQMPRGRACPDYHTAAQQRRDPYSHFYLPEACSMQFKGCPQGPQCRYSHTVNERQYHPILYRTLLCQTSACKRDCGVRAVCPLAHSVAEVCQPLSRTEYELGFVGGKAAAREVAEKGAWRERHADDGVRNYFERRPTLPV
jgi:hypothetical protein